MKKSAKTLLDYTLPELRALVAGWGYPGYRATQIMDWVYKHRAENFDQMTNIPEALRQKLQSEIGSVMNLQVVKKMPSKSKDTVKYLLRTADGIIIESVLLSHEEHATICVSTQAGCPLGCSFCASGIGEWQRDLSAAEIAGQILWILKEEKLPRVQNIVIMGMGEPFLNYDNVVNAIQIMNAPWGLGVASRKITVSTAGIVPGIRRFTKEPGQVRLSVSLHAPDNALRSKLMPINKKYPLAEMLSAVKDYAENTSRKVGIEYVLIDGVNDRPDQAAKLANLVRGFAHSVNLIPFNRVKEFPFRPPSLDRQRLFQKTLLDNGVKATLRREMGEDVSAACGQLRLRMGSNL